ncbi:hypothetical protein CUJ83_07355 [Methanocella sp. CWC-04]|uniref:Uncharacterized protein n=2 Tax=Methanooceanicella nereidis TaxID=2052831 RepID=A0AAP2RC55_9EURY|nr:hypothetical protein [Methanocella sp. CWC-04]
MLEAMAASILLVSVLACLNVAAPAMNDDTEDLMLLSSDMLNILMYRSSTPEHPNLGHAMSSGTDWENDSAKIDEDARSMLPDRVKYYMVTGYGCIGDRPPSGVNVCVRPFQAYCIDTGQIMDCSIMVWRA